MARFRMVDYRRLRSAGYMAPHALSAARTLWQWAKLENAGLVRLQAEPDTDAYNPGDCLDGMNDESRARFWDRINRLGVWGVVGEFRTSPDGEWQQADSIWGCAGYQDVLDERENSYVPDIMQQTISTLRHELKLRPARCPCCKQRAPHGWTLITA